MKREEGFTLVELMVTMALVAVLMTLGVGALRYYWLGQSLYDKRDEIYTNLRGLQQQVVAESNPTIIGAWFEADSVAAPQWGTLRIPNATTCTSTSLFELGSGVQIERASFADSLTGIDDVAGLEGLCRGDVPASATATDFVFFLARGTATAGCVTLTQPLRDMQDVTVAVSTLTGRVDRIEQDEVDERCPAP